MRSKEMIAIPGDTYKNLSEIAFVEGLSISSTIELITKMYSEVEFVKTRFWEIKRKMLLDESNRYKFRRTHFRHIPSMIAIGEEILEAKCLTDILVAVANWLINKGKLKPKHCPVKNADGTEYIVNKQPLNEKGGFFDEPRKLNNNLWIETSKTASHPRRWANYLLELYGFSPEILKVKWGKKLRNHPRD